MTENEWESLDSEALHNLGEHRYKDFLRYKNQLKQKGHSWDDAEDVLRGYIWAEIEND